MFGQVRVVSRPRTLGITPTRWQMVLTLVAWIGLGGESRCDRVSPASSARSVPMKSLALAPPLMAPTRSAMAWLRVCHAKNFQYMNLVMLLLFFIILISTNAWDNIVMLRTMVERNRATGIIRVVRFTPTSVIDGGGAQHIRWGSPHLLG